jgi:hypothetical protein
MIVASDPATYAAAIADLLADPARRAALGAATRERIHDEHAGSRWHEQLEQLVAAVTAAGPTSLPQDVPDREPEAWETTIDALHALAGMGITASDAEAEETAFRRFPPGAAEPVRVVAAPAPRAELVSAVVDAFRDLTAAGRATQCIVAVADAELDAAVALFETALAAGPDVDVELVRMDAPATIITDTDICVAELGSAAAQAGVASGALLRVVAPVG